MVLNRFQFEDQQLQEFHDETAEALADSPFVQGRRVRVTDVEIGVFRVQHELGRVPSAWVVVDQDLDTLGTGDEHGVYSKATDARNTTYLELNATASYHSIDIWVF